MECSGARKGDAVDGDCQARRKGNQAKDGFGFRPGCDHGVGCKRGKEEVVFGSRSSAV